MDLLVFYLNACHETYTIQYTVINDFVNIIVERDATLDFFLNLPLYIYILVYLLHIYVV